MISKEALYLAKKAFKYAKKEGFIYKNILTIVDFTKPSTEKRCSIYDMSSETELLNTWVTHGKNSGELYAKNFSNIPQTLKSSIGVYKTNKVYYSQKFKSNALKVDGLEPGFNSNARPRAIVIHWARIPGTNNNYIGDGKTGRSWGCFAFRREEYKKVIELTRDGTLLVAYYPDKSWLKMSKFLQD